MHRSRVARSVLAALAVALAAPAPAHATPAPTPSPAPSAPGPLTLERKVVTLAQGEEKVTLAYPVVVVGAPRSKAIDAVRDAIAPDGALKTSLRELEAGVRDGSITGLDYTVAYNDRGLLDLTYALETLGAYPDVSVTHLLLDTRTGKPVTAADCFDGGKLEALAGKVDARFRAEVDKLLSESGDDLEGIVDGLKEMHLGPTNLDAFGLSADGVVFLFDYDFPHVAQAAEPAGRFLVPWAEVAPYLAPGAPIASALPAR